MTDFTPDDILGFSMNQQPIQVGNAFDAIMRDKVGERLNAFADAYIPTAFAEPEELEDQEEFDFDNDDVDLDEIDVDSDVDIEDIDLDDIDLELDSDEGIEDEDA